MALCFQNTAVSRPKIIAAVSCTVVTLAHIGIVLRMDRLSTGNAAAMIVSLRIPTTGAWFTHSSTRAMPLDTFNRKEIIITALYSRGCFIDCNGYVRDVADPGYGTSCDVVGGIVELLSPPDDDGRYVIDECTFYPSLNALAAIGFRPGPDGKAISTWSGN